MTRPIFSVSSALADVIASAAMASAPNPTSAFCIDRSPSKAVPVATRRRPPFRHRTFLPFSPRSLRLSSGFPPRCHAGAAGIGPSHKGKAHGRPTYFLTHVFGNTGIYRQRRIGTPCEPACNPPQSEGVGRVPLPEWECTTFRLLRDHFLNDAARASGAGIDVEN